METVDQEFLDATTNFIDRSVKDRKPFFVWFNSSRMHIWTRLKPESQGVTGLGIYPDGMVEHDGQVGQLLKKLDDFGIANNTIVIYTTDNGAEVFSWPDGGTTPFRGEKNTNWEGGYRVPALVRWPGHVPPHSEINEIFSAEDWARPWSPRLASPRSRASSCKAMKQTATPSRFISTVTINAIFWPGRVRTSAMSSSTGPMVAAWPACATINGKPSSSSSGPKASMSGPSLWCSSGCHGCSICAPIHWSGLSMRQEIMCAGLSSMHSFCFRRRSWSDSTFRASANFHPASVLARSPSSRPWRCCALPPSSN